MKNQLLPKLILQVILSISFSFALKGQILTQVNYSGSGDCSTTVCPQIDGSPDTDYACYFSGDFFGNLQSTFYIDPNSATDIVTEVIVTIYGVGNANLTVSIDINGTTIPAVNASYSTFGCGQTCQSVSFSLVNAAGIPNYLPGGSNTITMAIAGGVGSLCAFSADVETDILVATPVELSLFEAEQRGKINSLQWQTATEIDNQGFYIERSADGKGWKEIGFAEGAGTSFTGVEYQYIDMAPLNGINYYRLVQMDYNGQVEISQVVSVNYKMSEEIGFSIFPNPSHTSKVTMNYTSGINEEVSIRIYSLTGKLLIHEIRSVIDGTNNLNFDLSEIGTGLFVVKIGNRDQQFCQKLLIR